MDEPSPQILVIAGPNGAGKSTCAARYLPEGMAYVNADEIAKDQPGYPSPAVDIQAARIALEMMDALEERRESFALETTLATRSLARRIVRLRGCGYRFHLVFVWAPGANFCVERVAWRVRSGGHHIPEETIRRRYSAGIDNFFKLYRPMAEVWELLQNLGFEGPRLIASGQLGGVETIHDASLWNLIRQGETDE